MAVAGVSLDLGQLGPSRTPGLECRMVARGEVVGRLDAERPPAPADVGIEAIGRRPGRVRAPVRVGRLDCLFLDEGFSSLDGESLEVAIAAVERMADHGRLVAIITHLPGVAERLGAAIHVSKDPTGTSHVTDRAELVA